MFPCHSGGSDCSCCISSALLSSSSLYSGPATCVSSNLAVEFPSPGNRLVGPVGASVGAVVGATEGASVVGAADGASVDAALAIIVGVLVGAGTAMVYAAVGTDVGLLLGCCELN